MEQITPTILFWISSRDYPKFQFEFFSQISSDVLPNTSPEILRRISPGILLRIFPAILGGVQEFLQLLRGSKKNLYFSGIYQLIKAFNFESCFAFEVPKGLDLENTHVSPFQSNSNATQCKQIDKSIHGRGQTCPWFRVVVTSVHMEMLKRRTLLRTNTRGSVDILPTYTYTYIERCRWPTEHRWDAYSTAKIRKFPFPVSPPMTKFKAHPVVLMCIGDDGVKCVPSETKV